MNVKKQLGSLARMVLPSVGFTVICTGAYLVSVQTAHGFIWRIIPAYMLIVFGFLAVLSGVFWTMCHNMKSKMYQRGGREQHNQIFTIER